LKAWLSLVLVYEDGPTSSNYFSFGRGQVDGQRAATQAAKICDNQAPCISFAVDYDASNRDIEGCTSSYFKGVSAGIASAIFIYRLVARASRSIRFVHGVFQNPSSDAGFPSCIAYIGDSRIAKLVVHAIDYSSPAFDAKSCGRARLSSLIFFFAVGAEGNGEVDGTDAGAGSDGDGLVASDAELPSEVEASIIS